jgi:ABC-2 type transport system permease protein
VRRAVRAEWTKFRTVPSTAWLAASAVGFTVALGAMITATANTAHCRPTPADCLDDTTRLSLTGVLLGQVAVVVLAVLAFSDEHASRMIHTTLAAEPRRVRVLAAKVVVVSGSTMVAGVVGVAGSLVAARSGRSGCGASHR